MATHNLDSLLSDLDMRIESDHKRMRRWRYVHRVIGLLASAILVIVPAVFAVGFVSSNSTLGRILLLAITVVAAFNGTFQPLHQSYQGRLDANNVLRMLDEFRGIVALRQNEPEQLAEIYKSFTARYAKLYEERGEGLIEATIKANDLEKR